MIYRPKYLISSDESDPLKMKRSRRRLSNHTLNFYLHGTTDSSKSLLKFRKKSKKKPFKPFLKKDIEDIHSDSDDYNPNFPFEPRKVALVAKTKVYSDNLKKMFSKLSKAKREQIIKGRRDKLERELLLKRQKNDSSALRNELIRRRRNRSLRRQREASSRLKRKLQDTRFRIADQDT